MKNRNTAFGKIAGSITVQWLVILSAVILPINVLSLLITNAMYRNDEQQISVYAENVNAQIEQTGENILAFLAEDNRLLLTPGISADSTVDATNLRRRLSSVISWPTLQGMTYIRDEEKRIASINGSGYSYPAAKGAAAGKSGPGGRGRAASSGIPAPCPGERPHT